MKKVREKSHRRNWRSFEDARAFVHRLDLHDRQEWRDWVKTQLRPNDIPVSPDKTYKTEGWISWKDWLGPRTVLSTKKKFLPFEKARAFARSLGLKSSSA